MDKPRRPAPIMAAVLLLLLPVLYVGTYLALVVPSGIEIVIQSADTTLGLIAVVEYQHYRTADESCKFVYWPLEQIDRKVRPAAWQQ